MQGPRKGSTTSLHNGHLTQSRVESMEQNKRHNNGLRRKSFSTPNLVKQEQLYGHHNLNATDGKQSSKLSKLKHKWGSSRSRNKLEYCSESNISAVPHYDLEFPHHDEDELISIVGQDDESQTTTTTPSYPHQDLLRYGWKRLHRGVKYQVPEEFSIYWNVTEISPNLRFKMKLLFDPDRRQVYINWDQNVGRITYYDGSTTYKVECKLSMKPYNIWNIVLKEHTLKVSCNSELIVSWQLVSDKGIVHIQPLRFSGKYFLTTPDGVANGLSELDAVSITTADSEEWFSNHPSDRYHDSYQGSSLQRTQSLGPRTHHHSFPVRRSHSHSGRRTPDGEIVKVKQLSSNLMTLIGQLENDAKDNDYSFKQKIHSLDTLSRNMVKLLTNIQRDNAECKASLRKMMLGHKAEQLNTTFTIEERLSKIEGTLHRTEYGGLAEGFTDVIQQYIDTDNFTHPGIQTRSETSYIEQEVRDFEEKTNDKLRSLNRRIKCEQTGVVNQVKWMKNNIEEFKSDMKSLVFELDVNINTCTDENRTLNSRQIELASETENAFVRAHIELGALETRLDEMGEVMSELELVEDVNLRHLKFKSVDDLSKLNNGKKRHLQSIQEEDKRVEDLERTCRDMQTLLQTQSKQIESLRKENVVFKELIEGETGTSIICLQEEELESTVEDSTT